jgi:hypothetical protein
MQKGSSSTKGRPFDDIHALSMVVGIVVAVNFEIQLQFIWFRKNTMSGFGSSVTKAALGGNEILRDDSLSVEICARFFSFTLEKGCKT